MPITPSLFPQEPYIQITNKHVVSRDKNGTKSEPQNFKNDYSAKVTNIHSPTRNNQTNNSQMIRLLENEHHDNSSIGNFSVDAENCKYIFES